MLGLFLFAVQQFCKALSLLRSSVYKIILSLPAFTNPITFLLGMAPVSQMTSMYSRTIFSLFQPSQCKKFCETQTQEKKEQGKNEDTMIFPKGLHTYMTRKLDNLQ